MNDAIFAIEKLRETMMKNTDKFQVKASRSPKDQVSVLFLHLVVAFTLCLVASNILETKQILNSPIGLTGGLLVFPISYVINDIPAQTNYRVRLYEPDSYAGVSFYVDWVVTGIDGYGGTVEATVGD